MCESGQPSYCGAIESSNCPCFSMLLYLTKESDDQISEPLTDSQWVMTCDSTSIRCDEPNGNERLSQFTDHGKI